MAAFAEGLVEAGSLTSKRKKGSKTGADSDGGGAGSSPLVGIQCLICEELSLQTDLTSGPGVAGGGGGDAGAIGTTASSTKKEPGAMAVGSARIAGPTHMLAHLGQVHPRQLLQVLHASQMLTGTEGGGRGCMICTGFDDITKGELCDNSKQPTFCFLDLPEICLGGLV